MLHFSFDITILGFFYDYQKTLQEIQLSRFLLPTPSSHRLSSASVFTSTGKTGRHISSVVGCMIRNQCMYGPHEYFIDNSGEIECVLYFKISLLRCNSKAVQNNLIIFICTQALRYGQVLVFDQCRSSHLHSEQSLELTRLVLKGWGHLWSGHSSSLTPGAHPWRLLLWACNPLVLFPERASTFRMSGEFFWSKL